MERFNIKKIEKNQQNGEKWISVYINDKKQNISYWIDCSLIDGYGNRRDFKTEDLYIDWDFNQYIFHLDNENDLKQQEYQQNVDNIDELQYFLDDENEYLVNILKEM